MLNTQNSIGRLNILITYKKIIDNKLLSIKIEFCIFANEIWRKKQRLKDLEEQKYENY